MKKFIDRKPTDKMYNAGMSYLNSRGSSWFISDLFSAMFDAAPVNTNGCQGIEIEPGEFSGCLGGTDCPVCEGI